MNYQPLYAEVKTDPRGLGYASMTEAEKLSALQADNLTISVPIETAGVLRWASGNGRRLKITTAAGDASATATVRNAALVALDMLASREPLDVTDATVQSVMAALVTGSVLSQSDIDALTTQAQVATSWEAQNWPVGLRLVDLKIAGV